MSSARNPENCDARFKICLVGNSTVGKTSLVKCLMGDNFQTYLFATVGLDYVRKTYTVNGSKILLEIWDTAGQDRFHSITKFTYRDAKAIVFVYDITDAESFNKIESFWLTNAQQITDEKVALFFIGNKMDLDESRQVPTHWGDKLKSRRNGYGFFETSAKTGDNVQEVFQTVVEALVHIWGADRTLDLGRRESIKLHENITLAGPEKSQCCSSTSKK